MSANRETHGNGKSVNVRAQTFRDRDFMEVISDLYREYPGHWVAMGMLAEDRETGLTTSRMIANEPDPRATGLVARRYHEKHPDAVIRIFTTDMAAPVAF